MRKTKRPDSYKVGAAIEEKRRLIYRLNQCGPGGHPREAELLRSIQHEEQIMRDYSEEGREPHKELATKPWEGEQHGS